VSRGVPSEGGVTKNKIGMNRFSIRVTQCGIGLRPILFVIIARQVEKAVTIQPKTFKNDKEENHEI